MKLADDLQSLQILREQGMLTDEEFVDARKRLLEAAAAQFKPQPKRPAEPTSTLKEFRRSNRDRWIGGVSGGLAEISGIPSWTWRVLFILTTLLHGIGLIMYILLWIFVPVEPDAVRPLATRE